jgi:serine/threonine-protein kinase
VVKMSVELPRPQRWTRFILSPDGSTVVYRARNQQAEAPDDDEEDEGPWRLWMRRLDSFVPVAIPGTEEADSAAYSPDGRSVAFIVRREGAGSHQADLRVVGMDGRPPLTIATDAVDHAAPRWISDDEIAYFHHKEDTRLLAISRGGGDARVFSELPEDSGFSPWSWDVVRGRWLVSGTRSDGGSAVILIDVQDGSEVELIRDAMQPRLLDDGTLVFARSSTILVARVDLDADPPAVVGDVRTLMGSGAGDRITALELSQAGHLAFVTGAGSSESNRLMTVDRDGNVEPFIEERGPYVRPHGFSPDGQSLSISMRSEELPASLWVMELDTGRRRLLGDDEALTSGGWWLRDGRLVFSRWPGPTGGTIMVTEMRRNAEAAPLFSDWPEDHDLRSIWMSLDGPSLAFVLDGDPESDDEDLDIWLRPVDGSEPARALVATSAEETRPSFSPGGRWLAYQSDESGRAEVYVRSHDPESPGEGRTVRVSRTGGSSPFWSHGSDEIFFVDGSRLLSAAFDGSAAGPAVSEPTEIIDIESLRLVRFWEHPPVIPLPDGERFLFAQRPDVETRVERIEVVLNWANQLER